MARKTYYGPIIDVSFDATVCQHSGECVRGMGEVFDTSERPWINPTHANTADLADQLRLVVARCPSGALEIVERTAQKGQQ